MYLFFCVSLVFTVLLTLLFEILLIYNLLDVQPIKPSSENNILYLTIATLLSNLSATYIWFNLNPGNANHELETRKIIDKRANFPEWIERLQLNIFQKRIIYRLTEQLQSIPSKKEIEEILKQRACRHIKTVNPQLQLIAFAIKPMSKLNFLKGTVFEFAVWVVLIPWLPLLVLLFLFVSSRISGMFSRIIIKKAVELIRLSRRYRINSHNKLIKDARPPILYLRPFSEDTEGITERFFQETPEEKTVSFLIAKAPVIAVGKPNERIPLLGAYRIYFDDAVWQSGVLYLMSISQLVVISAGVSMGTLWELSVAKKTIPPDKLNISFAVWNDFNVYERQQFYSRFKTYAEIIFAARMPDLIGNATIMYFDEKWNPHLSPPQKGMV